MKHPIIRRALLSLVLSFGLVFGAVSVVVALGSPDPQQSGTTGLQGTIPSPPPASPATITVPVSGRTFTATPITVSGLCTSGLLVKIFSNNIFVGSVDCTKGSYSLQIDLFSGDNALIARVYDALDQAGPDSATVTVKFQDAQFAAFGQRISLSSNLAKNGAPVGSALSWPIILSGGTGPYAITADWGDNSANYLKSMPFVGSFNLTHVYKTAGVYRVIIKATDSNGAAAFLQLVGVGEGEVTQNIGHTSGSSGGSTSSTRTKIIWWPVAVMVPIIIATFWVGRHYEIVAIHKKIEQQSRQYESEIQR